MRLSRLIFKDLSFVRAGAIAALGFCSCQFSTDAPLNNNHPHLVGGTAINKTLFYPDSVVCTLAVEDLNHEKLSVSACYNDSGDTSCSSPPSPWKGSCRWLQEGLGVKQAVLTLDPCRLSHYRGHLHITDPEEAEVKAPFSIKMLLVDPFNRFPLNHALWRFEPKQDSGFISFDYSNKKLKFLFDSTGDSSRASTGIRSLFRISGDFAVNVHFQLRSDIGKGYEVLFFLSTNPVATLWEGNVTGFFIEGLPTHIRLTCKSVDWQTASNELPSFHGQPAGALSITRTTDTVECSFFPDDPQWTFMTTNRFAFPGDSAVYVHLRMSVDDRLRPRHCLWSDLEVTKGAIAF